jgi:hypothetical protein
MAHSFEAIGYPRGTWDELNKRSHGGTRFSSAQNEHLKTSEQLGTGPLIRGDRLASTKLNAGLNSKHN